MFTFNKHKQKYDSNILSLPPSKYVLWKLMMLGFVILSISRITFVGAQHFPEHGQRSPPGVPLRQNFQQPPQVDQHNNNQFPNSPQYDRSSMGRPPRQPNQHYPLPSQNDIQFHDPTEFSRQESQAGDNPSPSKHEEKAHGHGIGEAMDAEHMKQHDKEEYVDLSKMSEDQLVMHHFRQYDLDKNGKVDGLEVFKKIQRDAAEHGSQEQS